MHQDEFFEALWNDFVQIAPQAAAIRDKLIQSGEVVENDHVAFRTFAAGALSLDKLEPLLFRLDYHVFDEYRFEEKHLRARAYMSAGAPRIFLSELLVEELSPGAQALIQRCVEQASSAELNSPDAFWSGRSWSPISYEQYRTLAQESEYAAWLCALGLRANHFTISFNALKQFADLSQLLDFVKAAGYSLNLSGGRIKGTPEQLLEQASTLADQVPVEFSDGPHTIPTCYYEFARRYPKPDGRLFEGFIPGSADKIFESTYRRER